ncbi:MAG: hypothetical protein JW395_1931 [Nitrospira sp.]|nr:hypothetical protein [Nitrospira sp.]
MPTDRQRLPRLDCGRWLATTDVAFGGHGALYDDSAPLALRVPQGEHLRVSGARAFAGGFAGSDNLFRLAVVHIAPGLAGFYVYFEGDY